MLPLYKELVDFYPKKRYWVQLSSLYGNLNQESNQLSALEAAHDQRLLNKESEYIALYQLLMRAEAPYKAAKALQYGFDEEFVERKEKNLKMLAQGWHMSQELKKAEPLYKEAAEKSEEGELFVFLGQLYLATDRYELAKDSLKLGLEKGKLKDPVTVNILLGQVSYEQQNFDDATIFFRKALDRLTDIQIKDKKKKEEKQDKLREQALTWLSFTEQEAKRVKILEQRKKDLENS
jgi:Tfp pilus assembly protein PilF